MKYWMFRKSEVDGPFEIEDLRALSDFGPQAQVCPEAYTGNSVLAWKNAEDVAELFDPTQGSNNTLQMPVPKQTDPFQSQANPLQSLPALGSQQNELPTIDKTTYQSPGDELQTPLPIESNTEPQLIGNASTNNGPQNNFAEKQSASQGPSIYSESAPEQSIPQAKLQFESALDFSPKSSATPLSFPAPSQMKAESLVIEKSTSWTRKLVVFSFSLGLLTAAGAFAAVKIGPKKAAALIPENLRTQIPLPLRQTSQKAIAVLAKLLDQQSKKAKTTDTAINNKRKSGKQSKQASTGPTSETKKTFWAFLKTFTNLKPKQTAASNAKKKPKRTRKKRKLSS